MAIHSQWELSADSKNKESWSCQIEGEEKNRKVWKNNGKMFYFDGYLGKDTIIFHYLTFSRNRNHSYNLILKK